MISLQKALNTSKIDTAWDNRIQSERFFNPVVMNCETSRHQDNYGREVCADSFNSKREGCNSALDRVAVENAQRPAYFQYVTLDAAGVLGQNPTDAQRRSSNIASTMIQGGSGGLGMGGILRTPANMVQYSDYIQKNKAAQRGMAAYRINNTVNGYRQLSSL